METLASEQYLYEAELDLHQFLEVAQRGKVFPISLAKLFLQKAPFMKSLREQGRRNPAGAERKEISNKLKEFFLRFPLEEGLNVREIQGQVTRHLEGKAPLFMCVFDLGRAITANDYMEILGGMDLNLCTSTGMSLTYYLLNHNNPSASFDFSSRQVAQLLARTDWDHKTIQGNSIAHIMEYRIGRPVTFTDEDLELILASKAPQEPENFGRWMEHIQKTTGKFFQRSTPHFVEAWVARHQAQQLSQDLGKKTMAPFRKI